MKYVSLLLITLLINLFAFSQDTWKLDNAHSNIRFEVGWQDFSMRTGEFKIFEGELITDSWQDLSDATFNLTVDPNSIDVIADRLSEQLKGERFLETDKFPEIKFTSVEVNPVSDSTYLSNGKLLIHGVEQEQEVFIKVKGHKEERRAELLGIMVSLKLNRSDFGLEWGSPRLGDVVHIVGHLLYQKRTEEKE